MKYLGIDLGQKRIGLAIAEDRTVVEYRTIVEASQLSIISMIKKICQDERINEIIIGLPKNMSGEEGEKAKESRNFTKELIKEIKLPIHLEDERLTSFEAERILTVQKLSPEDIKKRVDQLAAKLILDQYINNLTTINNDN